MLLTIYPIYNPIQKKQNLLVRRNTAIMGSNKTVVCIKKVKEGMPDEEWDETMPLPGDIIESVMTAVDSDSFPWTPPPPAAAKVRSELSTQLKKLSRQGAEVVWVRVRRGDKVVNLKARVAPEKGAKIHRRFTIKAARDDRHVAVLADLTLDQCSELQERSRRVVSIGGTRFDKNKGAKYDWKKKVGSYLPDRRSTVISSTLFMPFSNEPSVEPTITRCMAWFSAAVSSGAPLIFVNIQTEQVLKADKYTSFDTVTRQLSWRELGWVKQQSPRKSTAAEPVQAVRLWFLPGIAELSVVLTVEPDETRFGMDIKRTDEGFICIYSVSKGSASDRAGLGKLCSEANQNGHLVVISRLDGNSVVPSLISSDGLIHCCDHAEIRERLTNAVHRREDVQLHIMAWPDLRCPPVPQIENLMPSTMKSKFYI